MAITEIGVLRVRPTATLEDPDLRAGLAEAKEAIQNFTGNAFHYLLQVEDPTYIYLLGEWASLEQHNVEFHAKGEWKAGVMKMVKFLEFQWQSHFDVPLADISLDARVLSLERHTVEKGEKENFAKSFATVKMHLDSFVTEGKAVGGWRVEEKEVEQFWVLTPWKDIEQHDVFMKTEEGKAYYSKLGAVAREVDIKHIRLNKEL